MDGFQIFLIAFICVGLATALLISVLQQPDHSQPSCGEVGGFLCKPEECQGKLSVASDGFCCSQECTKPAKTCSALGGDSCLTENACKGNVLKDAIDTDFCCSEKCQKSSTCAEQNGFICSNKNKCTGTLLDSSDVSVCCSDQCVSPTPTSACNSNNICEGWESESCSDCQCPGTVCGGICHYSEGICCGDRFLTNEEGKKIYCTADSAPKTKLCYLPGSCDLEIPLKVNFDIPLNLELNKEVDGRIEVLNTGNGQESIGFNLTKGKIDVFENGVSIDYIEINNIGPGEKKSKNIKIIPRGFADKSQSYIILPNITFSPIVATAGYKYYTYPYEAEFLVYNPSNFIQCGNYKFSEKGSCRNSAYYFDWECPTDELTSKKCIDGIPLFFNSIYHPNEYDSYWGIKFRGNPKLAKGLIKVGFVPINTDLNQTEIQGLKEKVEEFYDRESNRILGRNMIDFDFSLYQRINLDYNNLTEDEVFSIATNRTGLTQNDYDFIIIVANKNDVKKFLLVQGEEGHYLQNGRILLVESFLEPYSIAHEINHGFGAPDLYLNDTRPLACKFNFDSQCLMCVQSPGSVGDLGKETLCTSGFSGWGDVDNDGVLDIDDPHIDPTPYTIPTWFNGISLEILDSYKNTTTPQEEAWYIIQVKDNRGGIINAANLTISGRGVTFACQGRTTYNSNTAYLCGIIPNVNTPVDITFRAEFLGYSNQKTVTFVP